MNDVTEDLNGPHSEQYFSIHKNVYLHYEKSVLFLPPAPLSARPKKNTKINEQKNMNNNPVNV